MSRVTLTVDGTKLENQELEKQLGIIIITDDNIQITVLHLKTNTSPTFDDYFLVDFLWLGNDVFPEHPKS